MNDVYFDEVEVAASICRESFYEFVREFWSTVDPAKPVWNWHIKYICDELQYIAKRVHKRQPKEYELVINIPPGTTKSTLTSIMFPAWVWTWFPTASTIGTSHTDGLARDLSRKNRELVKSDKYQLYFGKRTRDDKGIHLSAVQDAKGFFVNTEKGARMSFGVGGKPTGKHGDFLIGDDLIDPHGSRSVAEMKIANDFITETLWSRKKDAAITPTILIMQRTHQNDPSAMMLDLDIPIKHICLPAELTDDVKPVELRENYVDDLLDPVRLPKTVLDENKKISAYAYGGQWLQNPVPLGGGMFKTERIRIDTPPTVWKMVVRFWDKAGTHKGGAYTVGVKMGKDSHDRIWVLDVVRGQWDSAAREDKIKQVAIMDGMSVRIGLEQEPGSSGKGDAQSTIKNLMGYKVIAKPATGDKTLRAEPFSSQVNAENVGMAKADWNKAYTEELSFFPESTYKDQVDASSGAFDMVNKVKRKVGAIRTSHWR